MEISPTAHIRPPFWWVRWVPVALLIAGLIALIIIIGGNVLVPLLVSFALAFMLEPLADWFQRQVGFRPMSSHYLTKGKFNKMNGPDRRTTGDAGDS